KGGCRQENANSAASRGSQPHGKTHNLELDIRPLTVIKEFMKKNEKTTQELQAPGRRALLGGAAAGAAGLTVGGVVGARTGVGIPAAHAQSKNESNPAEVPPGDLDEYYVFFSGGQRGDRK